MHVLAAELEENLELADAVRTVEGQIAENKANQGLILDVNPFWRIREQFDAAGLNPHPLRGDSGAWLINGSSEWVGMVVAASGQFGFALSSDTILQQAHMQFAVSLALA